MPEDQVDKDWKLKLRYGKTQTPYHHYTAMAEGEAGELADGFSCRPGKAWMAMKTWASSTEESGDMIRTIGNQIGFTVTGRVLIYDTEPTQPPGENPYGYDIGFVPFDSSSEVKGAT